MAEYIDRENYCENLCHSHNEHCDKESCPIWKAPAADVMEVTRCKDCEHSYKDPVGLCCSYGACKDCLVPEYYFCFHGEKRRSSNDKT